MTYTTEYYYAPRYKHTSSNQHGDRFKRASAKKINVVRLSCSRRDTSELESLILFSHTLNVPVHYDFEDNTAYIEIMSAEAVRNIT